MNNAHIEHNSKKYYLIQQAHCEVPLNADYDWQAIAEDEEGNQIKITWQQYPDFDGDDCSNACDWDNYNVVEI